MEVVGIGLANIDLVAHVSEEFLKLHKVRKGLAMKVDDLTFGRLRADLRQYDAIPGGCVANTLCGMAAAGVSARFFGKIGEDSFESLYRASFKDYMVSYSTEAGARESSQCAVLVTPDGERSFVYIDGASWDLKVSDIPVETLAGAGAIYGEIYLFEFGGSRDLAKLVFETATQNNIPLIVKAMDPDFGRRYAQNIHALAQAGILSLLIGNHENLPYVAGTQTFEEAIEVFKNWPCDVLLTANKNGSYFIRDGRAAHYPITPIEKPKNTTGAGDQFTAGFLAGWLENRPIDDCIRHAESCARVILGHDTARPPLVTKHSISF